MKILVASPEYFPTDILSELEEIGDVDCEKLSYEELLDRIGDYDAVLTRVDVKLDKKILEKAAKLKAIGSATTGLDHIDMKYAASKGIKIFSLSGSHTVPTAEHTFSLILALAKKVPWAFDSLKKGEWERNRFFGLELDGKTLGIIGFGKIGSRVAVYAKSFGMRILTYDPYINKELAESVGAEIVSLDELLKDSDIITIHAFLSPETRKMINSETISKMKKTAFLVNVARGEIIDEASLLEALKNKKIAGAALDVFIEEPLPPNSELIKYAKKNSNLIITPHMAASTGEAIRRSAKEIVGKVKEFLSSNNI
ncbi:MAG: hydroxyacid dehydrogenase [Candidatus Aenigmarchaeota archaeon]|nr:hydroxyacid dehydrogenase [Candidatus Aenigmarchaeota archaeon]